MSFFPWIFGLAVEVEAWPGVPMISSSLGYHNGSIFHHQWLYNARNHFIYAWQAAFHMWKIGVQCSSASVHMEPNSLAFESFPMISKRYEIVCWVTPNVSASSFCVWHESSSNNAFNFASLSIHTFGFPLRSLSSTSNSLFLNFWNYSQLLSLKAASSYASTSNLWASAADFFKLKKSNRKFPQMTLIRLKTRHFRTKKNIWCKIANISRCCRMSNFTICRFTSNQTILTIVY